MKSVNRTPKTIGTRQSDPAMGAAPVSRRSTPWHAVSIVTKTKGCRAVHALRSKRFLSAAAPRLPLPECTMGDACPCAYKHFADRRGQPRRKDEITGLKQGGRLEQERRVTPSRRQTD
jgi:hypothetical protein